MDTPMNTFIKEHHTHQLKLTRVTDYSTTFDATVEGEDIILLWDKTTPQIVGGDKELHYMFCHDCSLEELIEVETYLGHLSLKVKPE